jgi:hypothetical protein
LKEGVKCGKLNVKRPRGEWSRDNMENNKYFVCPIEDGLEAGMLRIVIASSKDEAIAKYARCVLIKDKFYLEHIYTNTVNASFAEKFYRDNDGYFLDEDRDHPVDPEYAQECLEENVRSFFKDRKDFAELYLDFFLNDDSQSFDEAMEKWKFPEEMLLHMCLGDIAYFGDFAVFELSEIEEIS